jgi:single-strand DNA-binding protein
MPAPNVTLVGGVVTDPDLRFTPSGKSVLSFRLIVKGRKKDSGGDWTDGDPFFVTVSVWAPLAENAAETINKGDDVIAVGRLEARKWQSKDGEERTDMVLTAEDIGVSLRWNTWAKQARDKSAEATLADAGFTPDDTPPPF